MCKSGDIDIFIDFISMEHFFNVQNLRKKDRSESMIGRTACSIVSIAVATANAAAFSSAEASNDKNRLHAFLAKVLSASARSHLYVLFPYAISCSRQASSNGFIPGKSSFKRSQSSVPGPQ